MQIFVSWSKPSSEKVAILLRDWVPHVIQEAQLFVSSQDIAKGTRGLETIGRNLNSTDFGIVVLTSENVQAPWINFEAGALSKSLEKSHVIPLLCGIRELDAPNSPLRQFQHAEATAEGMLRVLADINANCDRPLTEARLQEAFNKWWPDFEEKYGAIDFTKPKGKEKGPEGTSTDRLEAGLNAIMQDMSSLRRELAQQSERLSASQNGVRFPDATKGPLAATQAEFERLNLTGPRAITPVTAQVRNRFRIPTPPKPPSDETNE